MGQKTINKEWEIVKLGDIAEITSGGTPSRKEQKYWNGSIPWVKTGEITGKLIKKDNIEEFITNEGLKNSSAKMIPSGSILMAMYGQGQTRGRVAKLGIDATINQACAAIILKDIADTDFVLQQLLFSYDNIRDLSNDGGQKNLSSALVKSLKVFLAPLPEQQKISEILSTWDEAIEKLERLIKLKEKYFNNQLKLFTQEVFSDDSSNKKLNKLVLIKKGTQLNKANLKANSKYPALNGGIEPSGYTDNWNTKENTIAISEGGNSCGYVNFMTEKFWSGGHCYTLLDIKPEIENKYLYYFLKANEQKVMNLRVGSGLPNIQRGSLENFLIIYPNTEKQKKIVLFFDTLGKELLALKLIQKYFQEQKQGLMQKLLTGKLRVKI